MNDENTHILVEKAKNLLKELTDKNLSQKDIATLINTSTSTLSKLKGAVYFPKNGAELISKIEQLKNDLEHNPKNALESLYTTPSNSKVSFLKLAAIATLISAVLAVQLFVCSGSTSANKVIPTVIKKDSITTEDTVITIKKAFRTLFESEMQVSPYSPNTKLPCYHYQNKWELDADHPYTIVFDLNDGVYYYRSKSLDLYAWCESGNSKGNHLEGLELFTNELWKDRKKRKDDQDSLKNIDFSKDTNFVKIAEISSIFSDMILIGKNAESGRAEPIHRSGKKIARYIEVIGSDPKLEAKVKEIVNDQISCLSKTDCHTIKVFENQSGYSHELFIQFDCIFSKDKSCNYKEQAYSKRLRKQPDS